MMAQRTTAQPKRQRSTKPKPSGKPAANGKPAQVADADTLDRAYRMLLDDLQLSADHREALRKRGLSDEAIDAGQYRTLHREHSGGDEAMAATWESGIRDDPRFVRPGVRADQRPPECSFPCGTCKAESSR